MKDIRSRLTLYELNNLVRRAVGTVLPDEYWVEAELSEARELNGHCYMELIQKAPEGNTPVARASAKCWRQTWGVVRPHFERVTGQVLHAGMKVLLKVYAQFHEAYGFSWIVTDMDPTYTLGDMARKRQEIIAQLKAEGVFELNKELTLPLFAQRIAVISSATAAGYGDFCRQLADNPHGYAFRAQLFPARMQGEGVEQSVIQALNRIYDCYDDYDCVVIIRGGGATSDLSGFDSLALAENVANFPLPVITGIGHDRDESVVDLVAYLRMKTPTAAAAFLIDHLREVDMRIAQAQNKIERAVATAVKTERIRLENLSIRIAALFSVVNTRHTSRIEMLQRRMANAIGNRLEREKRSIELCVKRLPLLLQQKQTQERHRLEMLQQRTTALDPQLLLRRGYSITLLNGKAVHNAQQLKRGDKIETVLHQGTVKSTIE